MPEGSPMQRQLSSPSFSWPQMQRQLLPQYRVHWLSVEMIQQDPDQQGGSIAKDAREVRRIGHSANV